MSSYAFCAALMAAASEVAVGVGVGPPDGPWVGTVVDQDEPDALGQVQREAAEHSSRPPVTVRPLG